MVRSLARSHQRKIERKNGRQMIAFSNEVRDVSPSYRDMTATRFTMHARTFRQLNIRICFRERRKPCQTLSGVAAVFRIVSSIIRYGRKEISSEIFSLLAPRKQNAVISTVRHNAGILLNRYEQYFRRFPRVGARMSFLLRRTFDRTVKISIADTACSRGR